jgi:hypothetical protein
VRGRQYPLLALFAARTDDGCADAPNVSGISEQLHWKGLRESRIQIVPGRAPSMEVLGVEGVTDQAELAQLMTFQWGPVRVGDTAPVSTAGAWRY